MIKDQFTEGQVFYNPKTGELDTIIHIRKHSDSISTFSRFFNFESGGTENIHSSWVQHKRNVKDMRCINFNTGTAKAEGVTFWMKGLEGQEYKLYKFNRKFHAGDISLVLNEFFEDGKMEVREKEVIQEIGKSVAVLDVNFEQVEVADINTEGDDIQEKYTNIVGNMSKLTESINKNYALGDHKDLADSFLKAKAELQALTSVAPTKISFIGKWMNNSTIYKKLTKETKEVYTKSQSTQETIDYLFGIVYDKYDNFVSMGESLQKSKGQMEQQIKALKELLKASNAEMKRFKKKVNIPIRTMVLNTQIKTSIEKYKQRLMKIDGAIVATQTTIMALAKDLPAMKTDLTDEMAIGSLLSSVDDYQKMYGEIARLVTEVTDVTAKQTHTVVENLMTMQIEDDSALTYLTSSEERSKDFAKMFNDKSALLVAKFKNDAETVNKIAATAIPHKVNNMLIGGLR